MIRRAGFTLIELLVTITIMVILLTLTTAVLTTYQANARDEERKTDVTMIAQQLEAYYETSTSVAASVYPPTNLMDTEAEITTTLPNLDPRGIRDPSTPTTSAPSLIVASSASTPSLASLNAGKTYIYQPLDSANALCTSTAQECRKFKLYYTLETDATVKTITSKHQ